MRPYSKKRARINRQAKPARDAYRLEFPWCQVLDCQRLATELHEIARGSGVRVNAILVRAAWLHVCRWHHIEFDDYSIWPPARQLAVKKLSDIDGYDLEAVNKLRGRSATSITEAEVDEELIGLLGAY